MSVLNNSWGRLKYHPQKDIDIKFPDQVNQVLSIHQPGISKGMGRSYGDACLNPGGLAWNMTGLDCFLDFDDITGVLVCEAGVLLRDIQRLMVPKGWMLPVTPGTQWVTVGGAIANDVHGKNHHVRGSFGAHVNRIELIRTDGETIICSPTLRSEWFMATVGGVGLTGVMTKVELQLIRVPGAWLEAETQPFDTLDNFFTLATESEADWEYTVAWVDCSCATQPRGLFMRANPTSTDNRIEPRFREVKFPCALPFSVVNDWSVRFFNKIYYNRGRLHAGRSVVHFENFFYPLDRIRGWNLMYGSKGFYQYQCVIPQSNAKEGIKEILREISHSGQGSFLSVLKILGSQPSVGMMSFPLAGSTLALDFPNRGAVTRELFSRLNSVVRDTGGRIYLAKDALMPRYLFETCYPRYKEFLSFCDPGISSGLSRRLLGR